MWRVGIVRRRQWWRAAGTLGSGRARGYGRKSAGKSHLERKQRSKFVQREAWDGFGRTVFTSRKRDHHERHGCEPDKRNDLLLRCLCGELARRECEFDGSFGDP